MDIAQISLSSWQIYALCAVAICWIVSLIISIRRVVQIRKKKHEMIEKGFSLKKEIDKENIKLYFCYKGKFISVDFSGDEVRAPYFINEKGNEINILNNIERELLFGRLTQSSQVPSHAYRVVIQNVYVQHDENGDARISSILRVLFKPVNNDISVWSVIELTNRTVLLRHPLMGTLQLPKRQRDCLKVGQEVMLRSSVTEIDDKTFNLMYKIINHL